MNVDVNVMLINIDVYIDVAFVLLQSCCTKCRSLTQAAVFNSNEFGLLIE
jgi:hypothetical protein